MPTSPLRYNLHNCVGFGESETVTRADVGIGPYMAVILTVLLS